MGGGNSLKLGVGSCELGVRSEEVRVGRAMRRIAASLAIITALATTGAWAHTSVGNTAGQVEVRDETGRSEGGYYIMGYVNGATGIVNNVSGTLSVGSWMAVGWKAGSYGELNIKSGEVTVNGQIGGTGVFVGFDSSAEGHLVVDGGSLNVKNDLTVGLNGTGTLTINGGTVEVGSSNNAHWTKIGNASGVDGTIILKGGEFKGCSLCRGNANSKGTLVFNGGTLVANGIDKYGTSLLQANLPVTVNAGGGTIDNNNLNVTIAAALSGTGGMTFTGGGTTTLNGAVNYTGKTAVTPGTILAVASSTAKANILANGLVVAGIPAAGQTILTCTSELSANDYANVTCPLAPGAEFDIGEDGKSIVVKTVGTPLDNYWTGSVDNDLSNDANWSSGTKPTGNANIFCATPAMLTKGATFAPTSITFLEGSAAVTINGDTPFENITEVVSLSSASHTINAKVYFDGDIQVKQAAMAETGDLTKPHVTFAGGAYAAAGCALESGNSAAVYSRCIFGKYYLASTSASRWTAQYQSGSKRVCVAPDSYLSVPYAGNVSELYVGNGAKVDIGDMDTSGRSSCQVYGEMVVTNIAMTGSSGNTFMTYNQGTATPGVYKFETVTNAKTGGSFAFCDHNAASKHVFYIGAGGINFSGTVGGYYIIGNNKGGAQSETIRPWHSDFTIADRGNSGAAIDFYGAVELCTDNENGDGRKMTIAAITTSHANSALTVSGKGEVLVTNTHSGENPTLTVKDSATLAFDANGSLGTGAITLGAGPTLALTATSREFTPLANTLNLPTEGRAKIRIDGVRLKTGVREIATVGKGTSANVEPDLDGEALGGRRATFEVAEGGKLLLNIKSSGTLIIVR